MKRIERENGTWRCPYCAHQPSNQQAGRQQNLVFSILPTGLIDQIIDLRETYCQEHPSDRSKEHDTDANQVR